EATGRPRAQIQLVADYARRQGLWSSPDETPAYADVIEIDLAAITTSLAGPRRPQDRIAPSETAQTLAATRPSKSLQRHGDNVPPDGAVAIAAITSCTNTSDPRLVIAAGLLARKARRFGLTPPPWVKTSLAPGSPRAARYLARAGLKEDLEAVGFGIVGYGCTTCIGNAGPLTEIMSSAIQAHDVNAVAVLSGNRNFPGRVHTELNAAFLASPPLVVAYALAGDVNRDIQTDPIGVSKTGEPVYLRDLWPSGPEIDTALRAGVDPADVAEAFERAEASPAWAALQAPATPVFPWDAASTYICRPPFATATAQTRLGHYIATPLIALGDDITTDHISPVGQIPADSDAGRYLIERGENANDLNVYAARRANWAVMMRGLFTNRNVANLLDATLPAGQTIHAPSGERMALWRAAEQYAKENRSVVVLAGARYGMGSSRDWAAKGVALLGVRAVLATSFEQIHRTNLIGMGVLPLRLPPGLQPSALNLSVQDRIEIAAAPEQLKVRGAVPVTLYRASGKTETFTATAAVETSLEIEILRSGGIIPRILARVMQPPPPE
ncbi:MAG: aconitate hydratase AcnA, partial [Rhodospirillaceae bacterium]|nr:aconitate hydratase AcnA [Rhodospirillaceae bacterium]